MTGSFFSDTKHKKMEGSMEEVLVYCSACGRDNPATHAFCGYCSVPLLRSCANVACSSACLFSHRFCPACGTKLDDIRERQAERDRKKKIEEEKKIEQEKKLALQKKIAHDLKIEEEKRLQEKLAADEAKMAESKRVEEELRRIEEQSKRVAEERKKLEEERKRKQREARERALEEERLERERVRRRKEEDAMRLAELRRRAIEEKLKSAERMEEAERDLRRRVAKDEPAVAPAPKLKKNPVNGESEKSNGKEAREAMERKAHEERMRVFQEELEKRNARDAALAVEAERLRKEELQRRKAVELANQAEFERKQEAKRIKQMRQAEEDARREREIRAELAKKEAANAERRAAMAARLAKEKEEESKRAEEKRLREQQERIQAGQERKRAEQERIRAEEERARVRLERETAKFLKQLDENKILRQQVTEEYVHLLEKTKDESVFKKLNELDLSHYERLKISRDADDAAINRAWRGMSLIFHPDKHDVKLNSLATIFFQSLTTARDELLDPQKRAKYDTALDRKARAMKNLSLSRAPPVIRVFCRNNDFVVELVDDYDWISVLVKVEVMFCCVDNVASTDFETEILLSDFVGREMMIFKCGVPNAFCKLMVRGIDESEKRGSAHQCYYVRSQYAFIPEIEPAPSVKVLLPKVMNMHDSLLSPTQREICQFWLDGFDYPLAMLKTQESTKSFASHFPSHSQQPAAPQVDKGPLDNVVSNASIILIFGLWSFTSWAWISSVLIFLLGAFIILTFALVNSSARAAQAVARPAPKKSAFASPPIVVHSNCAEIVRDAEAAYHRNAAASRGGKKKKKGKGRR